MKIERHDTGPRMSKAVIHGDTVYLAGIVADNPKGRSTAEQTRSILSQIDNFLATAGTDKTKLLSANIWIADMANFAEMNSVWDAWVSPGNTPARATVRLVQQFRKRKLATRSRMTAGMPARNRRSRLCFSKILHL
jgi:enamine deaminase RidA (YjgF/YER057c/UK114 family)